MRKLFTLIIFIAFPFAAFAQKEHGFDNKKATGQPYLTPEETVKRMKVPPEFEVKLFAGEPLVVNPIAFTIDEKGRVWVVECFEYPSRTPAGKMPRDRIVILEDTDGDGACDKRTVFAEGKDFPERFDLASGIEVGHGGVFLGAPPYLWFIENKNDKPGKFEKLLSGFGSQDTHETLNTFQWGPDGWLYGLHGIYTQSSVKSLDGPETRLNAAVWRYHSTQKIFETFAEGTSNPWGMDWRNSDNQFIVACCVIPHLFHIVPGGIYLRQAGTSFNPYSYGNIKEISDHTFHKESGWAHAGLISLDVPHLPEKYQNSVIFGSIHGSSLKQNILKPNGSTYTASRGDDFLVSGDKNVRPINLRWGPNGDIYLIDWHDQNPCHQAAAASWDYERGRIYRIQLKNSQTRIANNLQIATPNELAKFALNGATPWHRRTAQRLIRENKVAKGPNPQLGPGGLKSTLTDPSIEIVMRGENYQQSMGLHLGPTSEERTLIPEAQVVRIRNVKGPASDYRVATFTQLAKTSPSAIVRRELASFAIKDARPTAVLPLLHELMIRPEDAADPMIPQLIWTAYEPHLLSEEKLLNDEMKWLHNNASSYTLVCEYIVPRVMRRLVASRKPEHLLAALQFTKNTSDINVRQFALEGLKSELKDRTLEAPAEWNAIRDTLLATKDAKIIVAVNALSVSFRDPEAIQRAMLAAADSKLAVDLRREAIRQLASLKAVNSTTSLISIASQDLSPILRVEACRALAAFDAADIPAKLLSSWKMQSPEVRSEIVNTLSSRKPWAKALLAAMKAGTVDRQLVTDNVISRIHAFKDPALGKLIEKAWGKSRNTPAELAKQIDTLRKELSAGPGSFAKGKVVFEAHCAKCHKFEGKGSDVGPALDGAGRDIEYLLANVLDPNRVIGAPYFVRQALTADGQSLQGILAEEDEKSITLKIENGVLKKLVKADLEGPVKTLERSIMPEGLTAGMKPQDFRDLVKYLMAHPFMATATVNGKTLPIPVSGLIPLPDAVGGSVTVETTFTAGDAMTTKLLVGSANAFEIFLDGKPLGKATGTERQLKVDNDAFDVSLAKGPHTVKLVIQSKWATPGVTVRLLDPDRRISYQE